MTYRRQEPPNAVQIELAEGCNLRCTFCGLSGIREPKKNNFRFMEIETLRSLIHQIGKLGWTPRLEFAMHGEPTMHPDYVGMIRATRILAPRLSIMMTSNGGGLMRGGRPEVNVEKLFEAGLNVLALDDYEGVNFVGKIRARVSESVQKDANSVLQKVSRHEYPDEDSGNPHTRRRPGDMVLTYVRDIAQAVKGTHSLLNNHAGAGAPPNDRMEGKRCAKPFRELSVRHDGNVAVCCNSWRGQYKCGNVVRDGLDEVWNGEAMHAARQKLYLGDRNFGECRGCDAVSYRVGLLPDKFGKEKMPAPDKKTEAAIKRAMSGEPYTAPILREWEK